ncbi:MAG: pentapeptide repeat-containing protein [Nostoc sp. DedQUE08]|uniref:pentapeptide repeat-containing protein n=1 Tax=Nostoc sp. DedQUE08 TaxID=3075393 RepID=UPI002AD289A4|nr:pentapeptide repeat-containing protein [Nostoc sp. DedQUE08]MDZ8071154.1 pentapeptide repeat-containing protein [Nostoc sp. DedQUE08]
MQSHNQTQEITPEFFINAGVNLDTGGNQEDLLTMVNLSKQQLRDRWFTPAGQNILIRWKTNGFKRDVLDRMVGKYYEHTDIRGIPLIKEDLTRANLSKVDFYGANLENSNFKNADLTDSWLSETNIKGACFDYAKMKDVLIDHVEFSNKTSFTGVSLRSIDFNLSALLQEYATNQQRIESLKSKHPILAKILYVTCDYGRSLSRFIFCCLVVVVSFSLIYWLSAGSLSKLGFWNSLYFSIMAFTSFGSEIHALSTAGKFLTTIEVITGYLMTPLLVAILVRKTIGD